MSPIINSIEFVQETGGERMRRMSGIRRIRRMIRKKRVEAVAA